MISNNPINYADSSSLVGGAIGTTLLIYALESQGLSIASH